MGQAGADEVIIITAAEARIYEARSLEQEAVQLETEVIY